MKPLNYTEYKAVTRLSHNDFNRWLSAVIDEVNTMAVDKALTQIIGSSPEEAEIYAWSDEKMRGILRSVGLQPHLIDVIMEKIEA